jgi:hypothetical protein
MPNPEADLTKVQDLCRPGPSGKPAYEPIRLPI